MAAPLYSYLYVLVLRPSCTAPKLVAGRWKKYAAALTRSRSMLAWLYRIIQGKSALVFSKRREESVY